MGLNRYQCDQIQTLHSDQHKYASWAYIERVVLHAYEQHGIVPPGTARALSETERPTAAEIEQAEATTGHDVAAFIDAWLAKTDNPDVHRWLHYGLTSSDIVDTALTMRTNGVTHHILTSVDRITEQLADHALLHWDTPYAGRTHGQNAEPTRWGLRVAEFAFAMDRARDRLIRANSNMVIHISGPLGNYAHIPPGVEQTVARLLRLNPPQEIASQVVMRDRLADWVYALSAFCAISEAFATEIRHLARTEVSEAAEGAWEGRKGSSSMPHKRNPVTSEKICGLARVTRATITPILEGVALWHQRDISHSSVERILLEDAATATDHIAHSMIDLISNLHIDTDRMYQNSRNPGSAAALNRLIQTGQTRNSAYQMARHPSTLTDCPPPDVAHIRNRLIPLTKEHYR